ncbi:MAG: hypothetical protein J3Q66DRAFT_85037 [Benniella sp.]|nr:MAG: hypothetical protein J3Q66DRAFT_85037 [Benniella sp.]
MSSSDESSDSEIYIPRDPVVPLPVTGPRERKKTERFTIAVPEKTEKPIVIYKGKGTKLGKIPAVNSNLDKLKAIDEIAKGLHRILFGKSGVTKTLKSNLREFNGFPAMDEHEEEAVEEKLGKWTVGGLRELLELFNLQTVGDKDAIIDRLMVFLKKPKDSGLTPAAQKKPKKRRPRNRRYRRR